MTDPDTPLYLRRLPFCALVGIGPTTFNEWVRKGYIVVAKPSPRMTLVEMASAIAFLKSKHKKPDDEGGGDE